MAEYTPIDGETLVPDAPVIPGRYDAPVDASRIDLSVNSLIAGNAVADRVEIGPDGLHAYNESGTETASIQGGEGVFVGGEFRTSDALPGQVTLADGAYTSSTTGITYPGIRVDPIDATLTETPPGIGSYGRGIIVDGGKDTSGESSYIVADPQVAYLRSNRADGSAGGEVHTAPEFSFLRSYRAGGVMGGSIQTTPASSTLRSYREGGGVGGEIQTAPEFSTLKTFRADGGMGGEMHTTPEFSLLKTYRADGGTGGEISTSPSTSRMRTYSGNGTESGWISAQPNSAEIASLNSSSAYVSQIKASATEAFLYTSAGGTRRYLSVDASGVWVKTNKSGSFKNYNLEETAQDSGWIDFTPVTGVSGSSTGYRNKGGIIWVRGIVTKTWATGWNNVHVGFPADTRPGAYVDLPAWGSTGPGFALRMLTTGTLQAYSPAAASATINLGAMMYPVA